MGLSTGNGTFSGPLVFLNPRSKNKEGDKVAPHFEIARVGEDKKIHKTEDTCTQVNGNLLRPKFSVRDFEGTPAKHFTLYFEDNEPVEGKPQETYSLDLTYRIATRSLFNALISLESPDDVSVSIYESKKGYEALSLWQGPKGSAKMVPWKYDGRKGEIPDPIEGPMWKGKKQFDHSPTDDFFEAELRAWVEKLWGPEKAGKASTAGATASSTPTAANTGAGTKTVAKAAVNEPPADEAANDSDVPF